MKLSIKDIIDLSQLVNEVAPNRAGNLRSELDAALEETRQLRDRLAALSAALQARYERSLTEATDEELGGHELWYKLVGELLEQAAAATVAAKAWHRKRLFFVVLGREAASFEAHDKTFRLDGDLIPRGPNPGSPEHAELIAWFQGQPAYADLVGRVRWEDLRRVCEELAALGRPLPPHVKLYSKQSVRIYDKRPSLKGAQE